MNVSWLGYVKLTDRTEECGAKDPALWVIALGSALLLTFGCGSSRSVATSRDDGAVSPIDGDSTTADGLVTSDAGDCASVIQQWPDQGFTHVPCTSAVGYQTHPPSSGNHYACWPAYRTYVDPVPWGNIVHALEHGAIVFVYNCPDGCAADVDAMQHLIDSLPIDTDCAPVLGKNRIILMPDPDPTLGVRFAATAWNWTLRADCFDPIAFRRFFDDHYDHGREVVCSDGWTGEALCATCPNG